MNRNLSRILAQTPQGKVYYCARRAKASLYFKGRWFDFERGGLSGFRTDLARLLQDKPFMERLIEETTEKALRAGESPENLPSLEDLEEMLDLVDIALLALVAEPISGKA